MADQAFDPDLFTKQFGLTKTYHRDVYPAVDPKDPQNSAAGKIVLVTGASRGLGRFIASAWGIAGAAGIVVSSRKVEDLQDVTEDIKKANGDTEVLAIAADVSKKEDVKNLFEKIKEKFEKVDVVIANAGLFGAGARLPKIGDSDPDEWWFDFETNVRGTYLTAHYFITTFGPSGTFIDLTSGAAAITFSGMSSYGMTKDSCIRFVEFLHSEYPDIRAFSLNPGIVKGVAWMEDFVPFAHDTPELVGAFAVWLGTSRADCVRGGFVGVNWDVEELEKNGKEIQEKGLLKAKFLGGILGPDGYSFGQ